MPRVAILALCLLVPVTPAWALSVGDVFPPPPGVDVAGRPVDSAGWLRNELVLWHLFDAQSAPDPETLKAVASGTAYRYVALPAVAQAAPNGVPALGEVGAWRPLLRHHTRLPLVILTRPGGAVTAIIEPERLAGSGLLREACVLHLQRGLYEAALSLADAAHGPGADPIRHLLAGRAALALGQYARARSEAHGLGALDLHPDIRGAATSLDAAVLWAEGDLDAAVETVRSAAPTPAVRAMRARLALAGGDLDTARAALRDAPASEALQTVVWEGALVKGNIALMGGAQDEVRATAKDAVRGGPGSWQAWQLQGLSDLREQNEAGAAAIDYARYLAPDGVGAGALAQAARELFMMQVAVVPRLLIVLDEASVPHDQWPAAGSTTAVLLAGALQKRGVGPADDFATSQRAWSDGHRFGGPLQADDALAKAQAGGSDYLVLLAMHVGERGVFLNARLIDTEGGAFRGLESAVWTRDMTLEQTVDVLAERVADRLAVWNR